MPLDPVIYALSHAAFGAIALMALGYMVMLAGKLEDRDLSAEASAQPKVIAALIAGGGASIDPHYVYVYSGDDAKELSLRLRSMRHRLSVAYVGSIILAALVHSAEQRTFLGIGNIAVVKNAASLLGLPESLVAPFGFTAFVVIDVWLATRKYLSMLRRHR